MPPPCLGERCWERIKKKVKSKEGHKGEEVKIAREPEEQNGSKMEGTDSGVKSYSMIRKTSRLWEDRRGDLYRSNLESVIDFETKCNETTKKK